MARGRSKPHDGTKNVVDHGTSGTGTIILGVLAIAAGAVLGVALLGLGGKAALGALLR